MATEPNAGPNLSVGLSAFVHKADCDPGPDGRPPGSCKLDLDGLGLNLVHEMRHMRTPEYGGGTQATWKGALAQGDSAGNEQFLKNQRVANAEHMLNELVDYKFMFKHPWIMFADDAKLASIHFDYRYGEDQERSCFAWQWMTNYSDGQNGNPPKDGHEGFPGMGMLGPAGILGGGLFGRMPMPARPTPLSPLLIPGSGEPLDTPIPTPGGAQFCVNPDHCAKGSVLGADDLERCAVAMWAHRNWNHWMHAQMAKSNEPAGFLDWTGKKPQPFDAEPWNVLAHWAMTYPYRTVMYCDEDRDTGVPRLNKGP